MIKVRLLYNKFEDYCKYKDLAYEEFFNTIDKVRPKQKAYKNGNRDYWFKNVEYKKTIAPLLEKMAFESINFEVKKLK